VIAFGGLEFKNGSHRKTWFFDLLLEEFAPEATFGPGHPALDRIVLYVLRPQTITGKRGEGFMH